MKGNREKMDALKLGNELTTRRYLFNKVQVSKALNVPDYIAMRIIMGTEESGDIYDGRTYLTDISDKMQITIRQASKMISGLKDRGLVKWVHDGNGSEGTYVTITESGRQLFLQQEKMIKESYEKIIEKFGEDNLVQLLNLMKQLETYMESEMEEMGLVDDETVE